MCSCILNSPLAHVAFQRAKPFGDLAQQLCLLRLLQGSSSPSCVQWQGGAVDSNRNQFRTGWVSQRNVSHSKICWIIQIMLIAQGRMDQDRTIDTQNDRAMAIDRLCRHMKTLRTANLRFGPRTTLGHQLSSALTTKFATSTLAVL